MRKVLLIAAGVVIVAVIGVFVLERLFEENLASAGVGQVSEQAAMELQIKIDDIKKNESTGSERTQVEIEVSDTELESYVLYSLREDIPVQMDSIDVQLTPGAVGADTQLTFTATSTGNPLVDSVVSGTHNLFVKGRLSGKEGRGKFELEEIRVDGIPVPRVLIETLFEKYVKPKYPEADLKEPFDLPWGIDELTLEEGKAKIKY